LSGKKSLVVSLSFSLGSLYTPGDDEGLALILVIFEPILLSWIIKPFKVN
tara:strand:+ start:448 stop:597 length:150 start_codon:yes stop_codon:yes gene_type:complete